MTLHGLRVLVTRPRERASPLVQAIERAGGRAVVAPMLSIQALEPQTDADVMARNQALLRSLLRYQKIIFISVNAVQYGLPLLRDAGFQGAADQRVYAIGKATAQALRDAGIQESAQAANMNSESLLKLADFQKLQGEMILVVRGVGGREHLAGEIRQRGAQLDYLECYRREPPALTTQQLQRLLAAEELHAITVNSGETLLHLTQRLNPKDEDLLAVPIITPSDRVAELARSHGFTRVIAAANAGVEATLKALQTLAN